MYKLNGLAWHPPTKRLSRSLALERLEDRRVLASMADIVFLADGSGSGSSSNMKDWLKNSVFAAPGQTSHPIEQELAAQGFSDVRYGLVRFANSASSGFANSYVVSSGGADPLFGTAAQLDASLEGFQTGGAGEDGWDALEHVIAEYKFRPGAVPVVILLQNGEGRNNYNTTLVREGVLSALESKNVLLNTLVYGTDASETEKSMFDLTPYGASSNVRIFGVEADNADNVPDGQHSYVGINTATGLATTSAGVTQSDAMQVSYNVRTPVRLGW